MCTRNEIIHCHTKDDFFSVQTDKENRDAINFGKCSVLIASIVSLTLAQLSESVFIIALE